MTDSRADLAFRRFCQHGEPRALAEVFDQLAPELLLVAMHVVGDAQLAEDLVQSTFLAAIEAADRFDPDRRVAPWLCGILVNQARREQRRARRVLDPRRLAPPPAVDPGEAAAAAEFAESVAAALARLPQPYREVMTLHWVHGLTPTQIAHALGRPPGTVKTHLHRGLRVLKDALPAGLTAAMLAWLSAGRGLAAAREAVLAAARAAPAFPASTSWSPPLRWAVGLGLGALVTVAAAWLGGAWSAGRADVARAPIDGEHVGAASADPDRPGVDGLGAADRRTVPLADAGPAALVVAVSFAADGAPAADVELTVVSPRRAHPWLFVRHARTGADGTARLEGLPPGPVEVLGDRAGRIGGTIRERGVTRLELPLPDGVDVDGRVVDGDGSPVASARIFVSRQGDLDEGTLAATSAADGTFRLRAVEPGRCLSALADGHAPARLVAVAESVTLVLDAIGLPLTGRVVDVDDRPIAGAFVLVGQKLPMRAPHDPVAAAKWRPPLWLRSGSDGTFATRSLPRTVDTAVWTRAPGHVLQVGGATIDPERGADVRVVLQPGASLRGRVLDPHGGVVAHARLALRDDHYDRPAVDLFAPGFGQSVAHSDAAGEFAIDALLPVPLHVVVEAPDGRMASTVLTPRAGETLTWNPIVDAPRAWRGVLRDAGGVPLSDYRIELRTPPGWHLPEPVRTDAEGRFTLERLEDCDYWVVVWRPAGQWPAPAMIRGPLRAGPAPFDLTLSDSALASAQVRVRVVDESGRAGEVAVMLEDAERRRLRVALPSTPSVYRSVTLPPGAYRLCVVHGTSFAAGGETFELGAGAVLDLGELRLPPPGTLRLRLDRAGGATRRQDELVISGADGRTLQTGIVENGSAAVPLFPGRYFVHVRDETPAAAWPSVEIHSNATTELVLTLPPSFPRRFVLTHADDGDDLRVAWTWSDPEGRVLCRKDGMWKRHANFVQEIEQRFVPGRYRVAVECSKGRRATVEFEVDDREPPADAFELRLR